MMASNSGVNPLQGNYAVPRNTAVNAAVRPPMFAGSEPQQYTYQPHTPLYSGAVYPVYR